MVRRIDSASLPETARAQAAERVAALAREATWADRLSDATFARELEWVFALSEFVAASCERDPATVAWLLTDGRLRATSDLAWLRADLDREVAGVVSDADLSRALRRYRRRHTVRIAWRDLTDSAPLEETLEDTSALADVCIRQARDWSAAALVERHGRPIGAESGLPQSLMILGMGKLGGRELNFSSDVDLVYLYPEAGETDGRRSIANEEFFTRQGQRVAQILSNVTVDGFAYRVDLRLRPFGDSGPIATSFGAFETYLQQHGRDWERYAYVKARPITGERDHAALYDEVLRPFVYRRYLDFGVFESLRTMKELIAREVERRDLRDNIKLGPGGIREIEFIVQVFQLIRGGSDPRLQARELLRVLPRLEGAKLLDAAAVSDLADAYRFLRAVENRLQEWNDEQTHALPTLDEARARLATAMAFDDWPAFDAALARHRRNVSDHFEQLVFGPVRESRDDPVLENLLEVRAGSGERRRLLADLGIDAPRLLLERLDRFAAGGYQRLDETGRRRLQQLLPRMLRLLPGRGNPATTFARLMEIVEMIAGRTVYFALLNENARALERLVDLSSQSQFLTDQVAAFPLLLDELLDARLFEVQPSRLRFTRELDQRLLAAGADVERVIEALKQFQRAATFRIAVADLTGRLPLMQVSDRLTDVAELIVARAMEQATLQLRERHGRPMCGNDPQRLREAGMVVVAYGKLGGIELGYGSDLDLVFLHDSAGEIERTDGPAPLDNQVYFVRLAQRFVHLLTVHGAAGRLYEVDTRLRPSGKGGLLVQGLTGFESYQRNDAWTWEHQALLRTRAVAGPAALVERYESLRSRLLVEAVQRADLRVQVREMRDRMRRELSAAGPGEFDIKQDAGGLGDIEFLAQFWALEHAARYPEVVMFPDTIRILETLGSGDLVPQARIDVLVDTYRRYRARIHHLSLDRGRAPVPAAEFAAERAAIVAIWDEVMAD
jgi:glutamate-ammonia-ligase adenylyltransferase